jgi:hypothetical protein
LVQSACLSALLWAHACVVRLIPLTKPLLDLLSLLGDPLCHGKAGVRNLILLWLQGGVTAVRSSAQQ